jgi:hypothetical protein
MQQRTDVEVFPVAQMVCPQTVGVGDILFNQQK